MWKDILPTPLHPAVVHLPIALTLLVPLFAIGALIAIHRGGRILRGWALATAMLAALSASAWVSVETGEDEEDIVEPVVPETAFEAHEEAAERFFYLSLGVLGVAGVGLLGGRIGGVARYAATAGTLALVVAGYSVGHSGGQLVYQHGAASAHVPRGAPGGAARGDTGTQPAGGERRATDDR